MIETFRRYLDRPSRLRNELNRNAYYVYIIHVIVLGSLAWVLLDVAMLSVWKYLVLTVSTFGASQVIASTCRRVLGSRCA